MCLKSFKLEIFKKHYMITLEPKTKQHLKNTSAANNKKCVFRLITSVFSDDQPNKEAIARADSSYADYKKTSQFISLERLVKNNNLDS